MSAFEPLILIVDDDDALRRAARRLLGMASIASEQASRPSEALEIIAREPRIVGMVVDLEMPEMDGIELMRRVHAIRPDIKVGLWSASDRMHRLTPEELSLVSFALPKSGSPLVLISAARAILGREDEPESSQSPLESGFIRRGPTIDERKNGSDPE